ncbi:MAG: GC-type dockerin domain-anchored protein [Phycisphaerales bacterium]|nr:GC-type dockerin domain-anchored protein [Phycisphaerales bacterium]
MTPSSISLSLVIAAASTTLAQDVVSHFNETAEGWTSFVCNCGGNYGPTLSTNPYTWQPGAGYDGQPGYLQATDPYGNCNFFSAPPSFTGNRSIYLGGRLDFALRSNVVDWTSDDVVVIVSSGAPVLVRAIGVPAPVNTWVSYSIPLAADGNWRVATKTGAAATTTQVSAALTNITALRISGEYGSTAPAEIVGLDGVRLSRACSAADVGSQGGIAGPDHILDNNDFIVYIDYFFAGNPLADLGRQGGIAPGDDTFDNNDFIVFIDLFFDGCG